MGMWNKSPINDEDVLLKYFCRNLQLFEIERRFKSTFWKIYRDLWEMKSFNHRHENKAGW